MIRAYLLNTAASMVEFMPFEVGDVRTKLLWESKLHLAGDSYYFLSSLGTRV